MYSINIDEWNYILQLCDRKTRESVHYSCKYLQNLIKIDTTLISIHSLLKKDSNHNHLYLKSLINDNYSIDINEKFIKILNTNDHDSIVLLIDIVKYKSLIKKNIDHITKVCSCKTIIHLFQQFEINDFIFENLVMHSRSDAIIYYYKKHNDNNTKEELSNKLISYFIKLTYYNFNSDLYHYYTPTRKSSDIGRIFNTIEFFNSIGFGLTEKSCLFIIYNCDLDQIKWMCERTSTDIISTILSQMSPYMIFSIQANVVSWFYYNNYFNKNNHNIIPFLIIGGYHDEVEKITNMSIINTNLYKASCNNFDFLSIIDNQNIYSANYTSILYYAIKYNRQDVIDLPMFEIYVKDMQAIYSLTSISLFSIYGLDLLNILDNALCKNINKLIYDKSYAFLEYCYSKYTISAEKILPIHKAGYIETYHSIVNTYNLSNFTSRNLKCIFESNDIKLINDIIKFNLYKPEKRRMLKMLLKYSSFGTVKYVYEKIAHKEDPKRLITKYCLLYRDAQSINYFLNKGFSFRVISLYHAYKNNLRAAEWVFNHKLYKKFNITISQFVSYKLGNVSKKDVLSNFYKWLISKNVDIGKLKLCDVINSNREMIFEHMVIDKNYSVSSKNIKRCIELMKVNYIHCIGRAGKLFLPFCVYKNCIDKIVLDEAIKDIAKSKCSCCPHLTIRKYILNLRLFIEIYNSYNHILHT